MKKVTPVYAAIIVIFAVAAGFAQQPAAAQTRVLTADDYARAEKMLTYNTAPLIDRAGARPTFLPDGRFWYRVLTPTGSEYVLINPADGSRKTGTSVTQLGVTE